MVAALATWGCSLCHIGVQPLSRAVPTSYVSLLKVHEIDYSDVAPDPPLAAVLSRLAVPAWIFTARWLTS